VQAQKTHMAATTSQANLNKREGKDDAWNLTRAAKPQNESLPEGPQTHFRP